MPGVNARKLSRSHFLWWPFRYLIFLCDAHQTSDWHHLRGVGALIFSCCQTLSPNWYSPSPLSFFLCRVQMPSWNRGWLTEGKAKTAVSQHLARELIHQSVRSLALSPTLTDHFVYSASSSLISAGTLQPCPPSCPFPVDTIKTRGGDWSIRLDDLTVTNGKLACCCCSSGLRSAKFGLFCKPDLDLPLHPLFLYLPFSHASLRGGSRRILYITVNSLLEGRPE